jgi:hypothetical protein
MSNKKSPIYSVLLAKYKFTHFFLCFKNILCEIVFIFSFSGNNCISLQIDNLVQQKYDIRVNNIDVLV